jgi:hypothetical protein
MVRLNAATAVVVPARAATSVDVTAAVHADIECIAVLACHTHGLAGNLGALCLRAKAQVDADSGVAAVGDARGSSSFTQGWKSVAEYWAVTLSWVHRVGNTVAVADRWHTTAATAWVAVAVARWG